MDSFLILNFFQQLSCTQAAITLFVTSTKFPIRSVNKEFLSANLPYRNSLPTLTLLKKIKDKEANAYYLFITFIMT